MSAIIGFGLLLNCHCVIARDYKSNGPISTRNQNPIYLQNLSLTPMSAEVLPEGVIEIRTDAAYSNLYEYGRNANFLEDLDMEFLRLALHADYGISDGFEIGVEIPFVHFDGGFLDSFIQAFHNFFGFPNGGRQNVPNDQFTYRVADASGNLMNFPSSAFGLGDISFRVKNQLMGEDSDWPSLLWFAEIKFPTGERGRGYGSGNLDFGFGAALDASYKRLHGHFNAGYYAIGANNLIENYMYNQMFAYMLAGEVTIIPTLSVIVQFDGSTPLLTGAGFDTWDGVPLDLVIGFRGEEEDVFKGLDLIWQAAFSEDVTSMGPSVDFTVFASIGVRFDIFGRSRPVGDWLAKNKKS